jgi:hypothetical protein
MPNFDAGHYFLTVLLPIDNRALVRDDKTFTSPVPSTISTAPSPGASALISCVSS